MPKIGEDLDLIKKKVANVFKNHSSTKPRKKIIIFTCILWIQLRNKLTRFEIFFKIGIKRRKLKDRFMSLKTASNKTGPPRFTSLKKCHLFLSNTIVGYSAARVCHICKKIERSGDDWYNARSTQYKRTDWLLVVHCSVEDVPTNQHVRCCLTSAGKTQVQVKGKENTI